VLEQTILQVEHYLLLGHLLQLLTAAVGQVNIADDTANDFYITGVQLEAGTTASDFEFLPVDVNLNRCSKVF
jgi:hypothetical protein